MSEDRKAIRLVTTVRDIAFVSFGKYGQYVVTIVTVPLMARLLGAEGLGLVSIGMSSYFIGSVLVDLGITQFLAAMMNNEDVRTRNDGVGQLRGNYLAIRASTFATISVALLVGLAVDVDMRVWMILLGLFVGGLWSMSEDWVLIGQARFGASMAYQAVSRAAYLVLLIVVLPRHPTATAAMLCLLVSSLLTVGLTWQDSLRRFGRPARPHQVLATVRMGVPVLVSRLLVVSYGQGSATIYSSVLDAASLGLFSAGDRLVRAVQSLLDPIGFALLPRMARIADKNRFWRQSVLALIVTVGTACLATAALWAAAPVLIDVVYGAEFVDSIALLRFEVLLLPAAALTSYVSTAILPVRRDTTGVLIGAIIGIVVAAGWLAVAFQTHSVWTLVYGTVCCEVTVALWYLVRTRILYLRERRGEAVGSTTEDSVAAHGKGMP